MTCQAQPPSEGAPMPPRATETAAIAIEDLAAELRDAQMASWREGFTNGLEMAAKMTEALLVKGHPNDSQQVVIRALTDAFRQAKTVVHNGGAA